MQPSALVAGVYTLTAEDDHNQVIVEDAFRVRRLPDYSFSLAVRDPSISHYKTGDFDGDGREDIAAISVRGTTNDLRIYLQRGLGQFHLVHTVESVTSFVRDVYAVDINGDGRDDIVVHETQQATTFPSLENGTLGGPSTVTTSHAPLHFPRWHQGQAVLVVEYVENIELYHFENGVGFAPLETIAIPTDFSLHATVDWNRDGLEDLVAIGNLEIGIIDGTNHTLDRRSLPEAWRYTPSAFFDLNGEDIDGDGYPELVGHSRMNTFFIWNYEEESPALYPSPCATEYATPTRHARWIGDTTTTWSFIIDCDAQVTLINAFDADGNMTFQEIPEIQHSRVRSVLASDVDNNGSKDLVLLSQEGLEIYYIIDAQLRRYATTPRNDGQWFALAGPQSDRTLFYDQLKDTVLSLRFDSDASSTVDWKALDLTQISNVDTTISANTGWLASCDLNGDRQPDIINITRVQDATKVVVALADGQGGFQELTAIGDLAVDHFDLFTRVQIRAADMNHDGLCDVVIAGSEGALDPHETSYVVLGNATVQGMRVRESNIPFIGILALPSHSVLVNTNDRRGAILVPTLDNTLELLTYEDDGRFQSQAISMAPRHLRHVIAAGQDGDNIIVLGQTDGTIYAGLINSDYEFRIVSSQRVTPGSALLEHVRDIDGDGLVDVILNRSDNYLVHTSMRTIVSVDATGHLREPRTLELPFSPNTPNWTMVDPDRDGDLDILGLGWGHDDRAPELFSVTDLSSSAGPSPLE